MARNRGRNQLSRVGVFVAGITVASLFIILALTAERELYNNPASAPISYPPVTIQSNVSVYPVPSRKSATTAPADNVYLAPTIAVTPYASPAVSYLDPAMPRTGAGSALPSPLPIATPFVKQDETIQTNENQPAQTLSPEMEEIYRRFFLPGEVDYTFWPPQNMKQYEGKAIKDVAHREMRIDGEKRYFLATFWRGMNHATKTPACYLTIDEMNWSGGAMEGSAVMFTDDGCDLEPDSSLPAIAMPREAYVGWLDTMGLLQ